MKYIYVKTSLFKKRKNKITHVCSIEPDEEFFTILTQVLKKMREFIWSHPLKQNQV